MKPIELRTLRLKGHLRLCGLMEEHYSTERHKLQMHLVGALVVVQRLGFAVEIVFPTHIKSVELSDPSAVEAFGLAPVGAAKAAKLKSK